MGVIFGSFEYGKTHKYRDNIIGLQDDLLWRSSVMIRWPTSSMAALLTNTLNITVHRQNDVIANSLPQRELKYSTFEWEVNPFLGMDGWQAVSQKWWVKELINRPHLTEDHTIVAATPGGCVRQFWTFTDGSEPALWEIANSLQTKHHLTIIKHMMRNYSTIQTELPLMAVKLGHSSSLLQILSLWYRHR